MSTLDDVMAGVDTLMTDQLKRLFLAAGCDPTCHCCGRKLKLGSTFKLVPWKGTDEMCCEKCSARQLANRDKRVERIAREWTLSSRTNNQNGGFHGFSRPSKGTQQ